MERDSSINLNELINGSSMASNDHVSKNVEPEIVNFTSSQKISPLEEAIMKNNNSKGIVVTREEVENGMDNRPLKATMSDQRTEDIKKWMSDTDLNIDKLKYLNKIKTPVNEEQYLEMIDELESLDISNPDHVKFVFKKDVERMDKVDPETGLPEMITIEDKDRAPVYFTIKTAEELKNGSNNTPPVFEDRSPSNETSKNEDPEDENKNKIVQVIMDKTGLGVETFFTPDEHEKLRTSEEIRVKEVSDMKLSSIKIKKVTESFQEHVMHQEFSNSRITICFPASGFSAHMNGLTYGELGDASLSMEGITVSQYNKRLSIIYNKMSNISGISFKNYEDFLKHFAWTDIFMALYGLLVATFPEQSTIQLNCGKCKTSYEWEYNTRSLLKLKDCDSVFLDKMSEIAHASPKDYDTLRNNAAVNNCKRIETPKSGFIFEFGIISAYEFLYNFIPIANDEEFKNDFGDRFEKFGGDDLNLLSIIRKVYVPDNDGTYIEYDNYRDIMKIIFSIDPEESILLRSIMVKLINQYQAVFEISNAVCPNCGQETKRINVSMDDILFQTLQRLLSTTIDVSHMLAL